MLDERLQVQTPEYQHTDHTRGRHENVDYTGSPKNTKLGVQCTPSSGPSLDLKPVRKMLELFQTSQGKRPLYKAGVLSCM